ncbi:MAG: phosphotransferase [Actinomycetota bacterium]
MERPTIDDVLHRIPTWRDEGVVATPLSGGLTNDNYVVEADGRRYVVRIPGASTELLAVDRRNERHNAEAAATTGVSPRIVTYLEDVCVMVLEYVDAETMSAERLREPQMPERIASSLRRLHAGPRFLKDFNMFRTTEQYLRVAGERDVRIPQGFLDRMDAVGVVERALDANPLPLVPCNNDLLAENYLDDGRQLWIIDFEYSGNNDPCFELGDTAQESGYDEELKEALCYAYLGRVDPVQLARMELFAMMADVGWTLWAAIQARISAIDYDFWGWAVERWARAVDLMDSERFPDLLTIAGS